MDEKRYFQSYDDVTLMYRCWQPAQQTHNIPVVLLHGAASNSTRWWHFTEHSRLAADRLLLRPDLRGNGESIWRAATGATAGIEHWTQDIAAMLRHEKQERAFILGHCLGANIAAHFAARYPEMCAGLILVEPMAARALTGSLARLRPFTPLLRVIVKIISLFNRFGLYRRKLDTIDLKQLDQPVHQASAEERDQALSTHGSIWHDLKIIPLAQFVNNFVALSRLLPVEAIRCPGLVIQASGISMTDPEKTKALLGALPKMEFIELESEHWIPTTHPDLLCQFVDEWVLKHQDFSHVP
ncbi:MAG: alpha/beta hydrolase [Nitrosomonas sp.]|nr:alpha/beta hydrolase [Nitrosomonas sp.]